MRIICILTALLAFSAVQVFAQNNNGEAPPVVELEKIDVMKKDGTIKTVQLAKSPKTTQESTNPATAEVANAEGAPVMEFPETKHDFGKIKEGEVVKHVFKFKNSGDAPLKLVSVKGSCGCTVPTYPREDIAPGAEAEINVKFNSKGRVGKQTKTVTIRTNEEGNNMHILTITGEVFRPDGANHGSGHSGHDHSGHGH